MRGVSRLFAAFLVATFVGHGLAQTAKPAFEVASVKPAAPRPPATNVAPSGLRPGGVYQRTTTVAGLVLYAYDLSDYQLSGGPDWMRADRFDVAARAGRDVPVSELRLMLQSLLYDRFKFVAHEEQREMPLFMLVLARADKRLGPNLNSNTDDCRSKVEMPPGVPRTATRQTGCASMSFFATAAARQMGAPVIDNTGLVGVRVFSLSLRAVPAIRGRSPDPGDNASR
jgi:uncharacterized protein (TIGR03435 family)